MSAQLTLPVSRFDGASFANFYTPRGADAVAATREVATANGSQQAVGLSGVSGCGKTHLCWAACRAASEQGLVPAYIPLRRPGVACSLMETVTSSNLVCLDDIDAVAADEGWNQRLFSLIEHRFLKGDVRILVTSRPAIGDIGFGLADLQSRLLASRASWYGAGRRGRKLYPVAIRSGHARLVWLSGKTRSGIDLASTTNNHPFCTIRTRAAGLRPAGHCFIGLTRCG